MAEDSRGRTIPERLSYHCAAALPIKGVGLALMNDAGHQGVVAATDGVAKVMEEMQFALGEGPCVDASRHRRPVLQPDLARTAYRNWPRFGPAALEAGIAAIFSFPLQVGAIRLGILATTTRIGRRQQRVGPGCEQGHESGNQERKGRCASGDLDREAEDREDPAADHAPDADRDRTPQTDRTRGRICDRRHLGRVTPDVLAADPTARHRSRLHALGGGATRHILQIWLLQNQLN